MIALVGAACTGRQKCLPHLRAELSGLTPLSVDRAGDPFGDAGRLRFAVDFDRDPVRQLQRVRILLIDGRQDLPAHESARSRGTGVGKRTRSRP